MTRLLDCAKFQADEMQAAAVRSRGFKKKFQKQKTKCVPLMCLSISNRTALVTMLNSRNMCMSQGDISAGLLRVQCSHLPAIVQGNLTQY